MHDSADKSKLFMLKNRVFNLKNFLKIICLLIIGLNLFQINKIIESQEGKWGSDNRKITIETKSPAEILSYKIINQKKSSESQIVASKNGTRYYFVWCKGVSRIKEENKVWFRTEEEAKAHGLTKAKNC